MFVKFWCIFFVLVAADNERPKKAEKIKTATTIREKSFDIISDLVKYDENIVLSPLSIVGAMYMLAAGTAGNSRREILETINFADAVNGNDVNALNEPFELYNQLINALQTQPEKGYTLNIANAMFHQENMSTYTPNELTNEYVDLLKNQFIKDIANISPVDFQTNTAQATKTINDWVKAKTNGLIPELFNEPLDANTLVVLTSTLYFKASWNEKFRLIKKGSQEAENLCWSTSNENLLGSICEDVQWMRKQENVASYKMQTGYNPDALVVEIPMKNRKNNDQKKAEHKFMMQIWMPEKIITNEEEDKKFQEIIKENIGTVRQNMSKTLTEIIMPKFKIDYKDSIVEPLQNLGINDVFTSAADLSPMLGTGHFAQVSDVNHAVSFNVDEKGVEGAAVTSVQISARTFHQPLLILINKPFYFVVSNRCWYPDSSGSNCDFGNVPIFMGRVVHP